MTDAQPQEAGVLGDNGRPAREVVEPEFAIGSANPLATDDTTEPYDSAELSTDDASVDETPVVVEVRRPASDFGLVDTAHSLASDQDEASAAAFYAALDSSLRDVSDGGNESLFDEGNELQAALTELRSVSALKPVLALSDKRLDQLARGETVPYIDVAKIRGVDPLAAAPESSVQADGEDPSGLPAAAVELVTSARRDPAEGRLSVWVARDSDIVRSLAPGEDSPALLAGWLERRDDGDLVWRIVEAIQLR